MGSWRLNVVILFASPVQVLWGVGAGEGAAVRQCVYWFDRGWTACRTARALDGVDGEEGVAWSILQSGGAASPPPLTTVLPLDVLIAINQPSPICDRPEIKFFRYFHRVLDCLFVLLRPLWLMGVRTNCLESVEDKIVVGWHLSTCDCCQHSIVLVKFIPNTYSLKYSN